MYIYKYKIPVQDEFEIDLPVNSSVLCVQTQYSEPVNGFYPTDIPYIWVLIDEEVYSQLKPRKFFIVGTGSEFKDQYAKYIGTFQQLNGRLVWHLFERIE